VYGAAADDWWTSDGTDLRAIALTAQMNLAAAVVFRQPYILNALAWLVTRLPTSWPLRVRWSLGKYYHFGGLHVGAALAGTLWYLIFVVSMIRDAVAGASHALMILEIIVATPKSATTTTPWSATRAPVSRSPICALPTAFTYRAVESEAASRSLTATGSHRRSRVRLRNRAARLLTSRPRGIPRAG
jgi:hypothetical protein